MGYPLDLFLREDIEQEFICAICHDILQNVTMVLSCEHVFCRTCITQWNKSSNTCPVDRKHVRKLRTAPRIFLNLLNALQKRCQFAGCDAVFSLGENDSHEEKCNFNPNKNAPGSSRASKRSSDESEGGGSSTKKVCILASSDPDTEYDSDQSTQDHSAIDEPYSSQNNSTLSFHFESNDSDSSGDEHYTPRSVPGSDASSNDSWGRISPYRSPSPFSLASIDSVASYRFESASEGEGNGDANERERQDSGSDYVSEHEDSVYASDESRHHSIASFGSRASSPIVVSGSDKSDDDEDAEQQSDSNDEVEIIGYDDGSRTSEGEQSTASISTPPTSPSENEEDTADSVSNDDYYQDESWNVTTTTEESELVAGSSNANDDDDSTSSSESSNSSLEVRRHRLGRGRIKLTFTSSISGVIAANSSDDSEQATENASSEEDSD